MRGTSSTPTEKAGNQVSALSECRTKKKARAVNLKKIKKSFGE